MVRQQRASNPLYDLKVASRRTFWVAGCAGIIVFGSLMGAMFIGQQFLQNVLGYDTFRSGLAILPAAVCMVLVAPRSAKLVDKQGARLTMLTGYVFVLLGFLTMLLLWKEDTPYWMVALGYAFVGIGVGFAGTPASHSLTGSCAGNARGHGIRDGGSAARSRRRDHAINLRRAARGRLRRIRHRDHPGVRLQSGHQQHHRDRAGEVLWRRGDDRGPVSRSTPRASPPRPRHPSSQATSGPIWPGLSPCCSAQCLSFSSFQSMLKRRRCWPASLWRTRRQRAQTDRLWRCPLAMLNHPATQGNRSARGANLEQTPRPLLAPGRDTIQG